MNRRSAAFAAVYGLALGLIAPASSWAAFSISASAGALGDAGETRTGTAGLFSEVAVSNNDFGGRGYARTSFDFAGGDARGRVHGCVGPPAGRNDRAVGDSRALADDEMLTVRSSTLPNNTLVPITFCASFTVDIEGMARELAYVSTLSRSEVRGSLRVGGVTMISAALESLNRWSSYQATGQFAGMNDEGRATFTRTLTLQWQVGRSIEVDWSLLANTYAETLQYPPGTAPLSDGAAGYAMTFGVASMPEGVTLEWNGQPWTGSCENSSTLVPDNPVPGPAGVGLAGVMMLAGVRRRRQ